MREPHHTRPRCIGDFKPLISCDFFRDPARCSCGSRSAGPLLRRNGINKSSAGLLYLDVRGVKCDS